MKIIIDCWPVFRSVYLALIHIMVPGANPQRISFAQHVAFNSEQSNFLCEATEFQESANHFTFHDSL